MRIHGLSWHFHGRCVRETDFHDSFMAVFMVAFIKPAMGTMGTWRSASYVTPDLSDEKEEAGEVQHRSSMGWGGKDERDPMRCHVFGYLDSTPFAGGSTGLHW